MSFPYAREFFVVAVAHLLAVASPGPDFTLIVRQSVTLGRRAASWSAVGIGMGILMHSTYAVLGLGLLIHSVPGAFAALKYIGAAYVAWLGIKGLRAKPGRFTSETTTPGESSAATLDATSVPAAASGDTKRASSMAGGAKPRAAFVTGFLTNALNVKVLLFFMSLFTVAVSPTTPRLVQAGYCLWMAFATAVWFACVGRFFAASAVRAAFLRAGHWFDRAVGVVLLALAIRIAVAPL